MHILLDLKQLFSNKNSSVHETCLKRWHFHKTNPYFYFCVFFRSLIISCIIPVGRKFRPWLNFQFCTVHPESIRVLQPKTKTTAKSNIFVPDHTFDWSISFVPNKVKIGLTRLPELHYLLQIERSEKSCFENVYEM